MYCLPLDDACQMDRLQYKLVTQAAEEDSIEQRTFSLGTFNGRKYTYTWFGKTPVIIIDEIGKPLSEMPDILGE
jgi:hypothetical protein